MRKPARGALFFAFLYLLCFFSFCPSVCTAAGRDALLLCAKGLIPSLFPFLVLSALFVSTGICRRIGQGFCRLSNDFLHLGASGSGAYLLGLIAGFPTGASTVFYDYENGIMEKRETEQLCGIFNQTGPAFLIGFIGGYLFRDTMLGMRLFFCQFCAGLLLLILTRHTRTKQSIPPVKKSHIPHGGLCAVFARTVRESTVTMLTICGFFVFFSVLLRVVLATLTPVFGDRPLVYALLSGMMEITAGSISCAALPSGDLLCALVCGWAGFSVHFQAASFAPEGLSLVPYFRYKAIGALLTCGFYALFFRLGNVVSPIYLLSVLPVAAGSLFILSRSLRRRDAK